MRKTIWVGTAWLLAISLTVGCAGRRPFTPAGSPMAKNDWRSPKGAQPLGTQQAMGNGNSPSGSAPPPQFPSGSSNPQNQNAFGQLPPGMMPCGGSGVQQTQYEQMDTRRPIATNASNVNKSMPPTAPPNPFGMPPGSPPGQFEPMPIGTGSVSNSPEQVPNALMKSFGSP